MPGVPSSRGCDACRRQKKKCDQEKPACGRCARLQIECIGSGQQRYKFHNKTVTQPPVRRRSPGSSHSSSGTDQASSSSSSSSSLSLTTRPVLLSSPCGNAQSVVIDRLVSALEVSDPRFDLSVYGSFLRDIPQRVGSSPALDAATSALAASLPLVVKHSSSNDYDKSLQPVNRATVPMLQQYGRALQALRGALSDPVAIRAPNTLCALYLIVITQGWLQHEEGHFPSHGEAVAMILRSMKGRQPSWGAFEQNILSTLCFLVIMESLINPRIKPDDNLWNMPEPHGPPSATDEPVSIESFSNYVLARIVKLLRAPTTYQRELVEAYHRVRIDRSKMSNLLATIPVVPSPDGRNVSPIAEALCRVHLRWQTAYAMLTLIVMRIGAVLSAAVPLVDNMDVFIALNLNSDFHAYIDDIATVAEQALQYYPLGSSFMPLCLLAAYSALGFTGSDASQRTRILHLFSEYRPGFDIEKELTDVAKVPQSGGTGDQGRAAPPAVINCGNEDTGVALAQSAMCSIL